MDPITGTDIGTAQMLRLLVSDASEKMDCEGMDRTYILEDLMGSVLRAAKVLDGRSAPDELLTFERATPAYEIGERS
jgi:hypothetical protein